MRKWLYEQVKAEPSQAALFGDRIFSSGTTKGASGTAGDIPTKPFIILRSGTDQPSIARSQVIQQNWQVWCHIDPGSLLPIDKFINSLKVWLPKRAPMAIEDDWIMECEFINASGDLPDDHYKTTTRFAEFKVTAREGLYLEPAP